MEVAPEIAPMSALLDQAVKACLESGQYNLPLLPESTARLLELLQSPEVDFREVDQLVSSEAALAARVLRVANTSAFRNRRAVASIREALTRVGTRQVMRIALSEQVASVFHVPGYEALARANWWDARVCSVYAASLAAALGEDDDTAFVCGLLHAVGRPIVLQVVVQVAEQLREGLSKTAARGWVEAWYVPVGRRLSRSWELPEVVQAAISMHRRPFQAREHQRMVQICALAASLCAGSPLSPEDLDAFVEHPLARALEVSRELLEEVVDPTLSGILAA